MVSVAAGESYPPSQHRDRSTERRLDQTPILFTTHRWESRGIDRHIDFRPWSIVHAQERVLHGLNWINVTTNLQSDPRAQLIDLSAKRKDSEVQPDFLDMRDSFEKESAAVHESHTASIEAPHNATTSASFNGPGETTSGHMLKRARSS